MSRSQPHTRCARARRQCAAVTQIIAVPCALVVSLTMFPVAGISGLPARVAFGPQTRCPPSARSRVDLTPLRAPRCMEQSVRCTQRLCRVILAGSRRRGPLTRRRRGRRALPASWWTSTAASSSPIAMWSRRAPSSPVRHLLNLLGCPLWRTDGPGGGPARLLGGPSFVPRARSRRYSGPPCPQKAYFRITKRWSSSPSTTTPSTTSASCALIRPSSATSSSTRYRCGPIWRASARRSASSATTAVRSAAHVPSRGACATQHAAGTPPVAVAARPLLCVRYIASNNSLLRRREALDPGRDHSAPGPQGPDVRRQELQRLQHLLHPGSLWHQGRQLGVARRGYPRERRGPQRRRPHQGSDRVLPAPVEGRVGSEAHPGEDSNSDVMYECGGNAWRRQGH